MTHHIPPEVMLFCFAALAASYRLRVGLKTITVIDHHGEKVGAWNAQTERWSIDHDRGRGSESALRIVSPGVVYEGLKVKEAATVSLGKFGFANQANQEHHDDYHQDHYGTGRAR